MDRTTLIYRCRRCGELFEGETVHKDVSWILAYNNMVYMRCEHKCDVKNASMIGVGDIIGLNVSEQNIR